MSDRAVIAKLPLARAGYPVALLAGRNQKVTDPENLITPKTGAGSISRGPACRDRLHRDLGSAWLSMLIERNPTKLNVNQ